MTYALRIDDHKNIHGISDPLALIREGHAFAKTVLGEEVATRMLRAFGGAAQVNAVPKERLLACAAAFARFCNPNLKPRAPLTDKPVQAHNQLEADVAKLKFAEAKRRRDEKGQELWNIMRGLNLYEHLHPKLAGFAREYAAMGSGQRVTHYGKEYRTARDLYREHELMIVDFDKQFARDNPGYETFAEYIRSGLIVSTFGTWEKPCALGLKQLQFILTGKE